MKKFINLKSITIFLFLLVTSAAVLFFLPKKPGESPTQTPLPTQGAREIPQGDSINVSGVKVNNPYNKAETTGELGDALFVDETYYKIVYYPDDKAFLISIQGSPFETIRNQAEEKFLQELGIDQTQACRLQVWITTPNYINPAFAGQNYRLSFCK